MIRSRYTSKVTRAISPSSRAKKSPSSRAFCPRQLDQNEIEAAAVIAEIRGAGIKNMSRIMATLRERYSGSIDLSRAAAIVRQLLG